MSNKRKNTARATRRMATSAVLCALAASLLGIGALIEVFDLSAAAFASLTLIPILLCYGSRWAWLSYAVTATLGLILMPHSMASWMFAGLTGYYPIIKQRLDRLPRVVGWAIKLVLLTAILLLYLAVFHFIILGGEGSFLNSFLTGFGEAEGTPIMAWAVVVLSVITFVLFDVLIDRLLILYYLKWQKRVERIMGGGMKR